MKVVVLILIILGWALILVATGLPLLASIQVLAMGLASLISALIVQLKVKKD